MLIIKNLLMTDFAVNLQ